MKLAAVILALLMSGCAYVPPRIHLTPGPSIVYADDGDTMVVSEGYVYAIFQRWARVMGDRLAMGRLVNSRVCVETRVDGKWVVRKSILMEVEK
jgi:hypothetical protein